MPSLFKQWRYQLEALGLRILAAVVPRLPRGLCLAFAKVAGTLAAVLDRAGRRVALSNLEAAFGATLARPERRRIVRESYQSFARSMVDLFWSARLTSENYAALITIENRDRFEREIAPTGSCIFACLHYGNFEWMSHAMAFLGYDTDVVAQEFKNPLLGVTFDRLRENAGNRVVPRRGAFVRLYKILKRGGRVALFADLTIPASGASVAIRCFGLETCVTAAPAWLHEKTGAPIIPVHCEPLADGRYRFVIHPAIRARGGTPRDISQQCWDCFEPVVRAQPAPWLWMYKHWRYQPEAAQRDYPPYANVSRAFEEVLTRSHAPVPGGGGKGLI